jgi:hypothetical protein
LAFQLRGAPAKLSDSLSVFARNAGVIVLTSITVINPITLLVRQLLAARSIKFLQEANILSAQLSIESR